MEHTLESYDDIAVRKDLSYLCIIIVLILHILLLLLLFTFTHLIVKSEPMTPSFDTMFDVAASTAGSSAQSDSGTSTTDDEETTSYETSDTGEGYAVAEETSTESDDTAVASQEPESTSPMALLPEGAQLPDVIDQVVRSDSPISQQPIFQHSVSIPRTKTTGRVTYRVRRTRYDTHYSINGTSLAQMGQQVHNNITQSIATAAKEKKTKELKYQSYVNGLHKFLYGNFNPRNESINLEYSVYMPIDVDIEIDSNGACKNITLSNSTGDRDLDSFIIYHLKKSGPFPPLPNHFGVPSWHFQLRLMVNCQRGKGIPKITPH
jgi:hypothetical protein